MLSEGTVSVAGVGVSEERSEEFEVVEVEVVLLRGEIEGVNSVLLSVPLGVGE